MRGSWAQRGANSARRARWVLRAGWETKNGESVDGSVLDHASPQKHTSFVRGHVVNSATIRKGSERSGWNLADMIQGNWGNVMFRCGKLGALIVLHQSYLLWWFCPHKTFDAWASARVERVWAQNKKDSALLFSTLFQHCVYKDVCWDLQGEREETWRKVSKKLKSKGFNESQFGVLFFNPCSQYFDMFFYVLRWGKKMANYLTDVSSTKNCQTFVIWPLLTQKLH